MAINIRIIFLSLFLLFFFFASNQYWLFGMIYPLYFFSTMSLVSSLGWL
jgi:hypothetical protein